MRKEYDSDKMKGRRNCVVSGKRPSFNWAS
jgi:hypothetical protein